MSAQEAGQTAGSMNTGREKKSQMEKRKVTVRIGGQRCSFLSDDPDEYISVLEKRANEVMQETAAFSGLSVQTNALLSVLFQTDRLLRMEASAGREKKPAPGPAARKPQPKSTGKEQISVWDLLEEK